MESSMVGQLGAVCGGLAGLLGELRHAQAMGSLPEVLRREATKQIHVSQFDGTIELLQEALEAVFRDQVSEVVEGLERLSGTRSHADTADSLISQVFNPEEWTSAIVDAAFPAMAAAASEAGISHLRGLSVPLSVQERSARPFAEMRAGGWTKETTATQWLENSGIDLPPGVETSLPNWMVSEIGDLLKDAFSQSWWAALSGTTSNDIRGFIEGGLREGWSIRRISEEITGRFGLDYTRSRAKLVAITESGNVLNGIRTRVVDRVNEELGGEVRLVNVWLSIFARTSREDHMDLSGVEEDEDGFWNLSGHLTPWPGHFGLPASQRVNCLVGDVEVSGQFCGAQRAWYDGIVTEIMTASGGSLTCTPNHPIVTRQRLAGAGELKPGDEVMTYLDQVNDTAGFSLSGKDIKHEPASIEKVFEAFLSGARSSGSIKVSRSDFGDFYGDGKSIQGDIEVVRVDWKLLQNRHSSKSFDVCGNEIFIPKLAQLFSESSSRARRLDGCRVGLAHSGGPCVAEMPVDELARCVVTPLGSLSVGMVSDFNSCLDKSASQERSAIVRFVRDAEQRFSGKVSFDEVVEVRNLPFSGHVYDLQSDYGHIAARNPGSTSSIVTSNCYCTVYARVHGDQGRLEDLGDF